MTKEPYPPLIIVSAKAFPVEKNDRTAKLSDRRVGHISYGHDEHLQKASNQIWK